MAERDAGRPAPDTLSTEEADRLSERFRPSWEPDPPTVPRVGPAPAAAGKPLPSPQASPAPALKPSQTVPIIPGGAGKAPRPTTLVGIQPTIPVSRSAAPDDLDWEAPTNPI